MGFILRRRTLRAGTRISVPTWLRWNVSIASAIMQMAPENMRRVARRFTGFRRMHVDPFAGPRRDSQRSLRRYADPAGIHHRARRSADGGCRLARWDGE